MIRGYTRVSVGVCADLCNYPYFCMWVCACICACVCVRVCTCVCACICGASVRVSLVRVSLVRVCMCLCVHLGFGCVCVWVCVCVCVCVFLCFRCRSICMWPRPAQCTKVSYEHFQFEPMVVFYADNGMILWHQATPMIVADRRRFCSHSLGNP